MQAASRGGRKVFRLSLKLNASLSLALSSHRVLGMKQRYFELLHFLRPLSQTVLSAALLTAGVSAQAWVLTIAAGSRVVYLAVGNASTNANNATVNLVSVSVPAAAVGNSTPQPMTSNSTQANSPLDNFAVCQPALGQVYIGGYLRQPAGSAINAVMQVTTPANLTSGADAIPFNQISWTSTALGNTTADIPAGTFTGATQFLRNIAANTYVENCHTFRYANTALRAAGTYTGRATYTLVAP
jgi:hypothetical protein